MNIKEFPFRFSNLKPTHFFFCVYVSLVFFHFVLQLRATICVVTCMYIFTYFVLYLPDKYPRDRDIRAKFMRLSE